MYFRKITLINLQTVARNWGGHRTGDGSVEQAVDHGRKKIKDEMMTVLGSPAAVTEHHTLGGLNSRCLLLTVMGAASPRSRHQEIWYLVRTLC